MRTELGATSFSEIPEDETEGSRLAGACTANDREDVSIGPPQKAREKLLFVARTFGARVGYGKVGFKKGLSPAQSD